MTLLTVVYGYMVGPRAAWSSVIRGKPPFTSCSIFPGPVHGVSPGEAIALEDRQKETRARRGFPGLLRRGSDNGMVGDERLELSAYGFGGQRSIHLS